MHLTSHALTGVPGPHETGWVDDVLTALRRFGEPSGALVSRALTIESGYAVALWSDPSDAARVVAAGELPGPRASGVRVGAGRAYRVGRRRTGPAAGPPRYVQVVAFDGPRSAEWVAAQERADEERIWPAVRDVPGGIGALTCRAEDGGSLTLVLAESVEALEEAMVRILSTDLLPGEDPALLTGPDCVEIQRLLHADVPSLSASLTVTGSRR